MHKQTRTQNFGTGKIPFMAPEVQLDLQILPSGTTQICNEETLSGSQLSGNNTRALLDTKVNLSNVDKYTAFDITNEEPE